MAGRRWHWRRASTHAIVQERLGHTNISVTLGIYSHAIAGLDKEAAEQAASMFLPVSSS